MTLKLNYTQRLNMIAVLDSMEVQGRREIHAICKLQDEIDLSDEEKKSISYEKHRTPNGQEYATWALNSDGYVKEFKLSDADSSRITRAIDSYRVALARDKSWWMPLISQMPVEEENVSRS